MTESDLRNREDKSSSPLVVMDYSSTGVVKSSTKRNWMKQLSEQINEWEDEVHHQPMQKKSLTSDQEAVTSFLETEEQAAAKPPRHSDGKLREQVEDSMHEKIRDWRNMTAESAIGNASLCRELDVLRRPVPISPPLTRVCFIDVFRPCGRMAITRKLPHQIFISGRRCDEAFLR